MRNNKKELAKDNSYVGYKSDFSKIHDYLSTDLELGELTKVYKRNRNKPFVKYPKSASEHDASDSLASKSRKLIRVAVHKNVSLPLLFKLSKHSNPAVRIAAVDNSIFPDSQRMEAYNDIIAHQGYGDKYILLEVLSKEGISENVLNRNIQDLFHPSEFMFGNSRFTQAQELFFKEEIESDKYGCEDIYFRPLESKPFNKSLFKLALMKNLDLETIKKIIHSQHYRSSVLLCLNTNLTDESYKALFESNKNNVNKGRKAREPFITLANNLSTPKEILAEMVDMSIEDDSLYARRSCYSTIAYNISENISTPIEALLKLRELHNHEAYDRYMKNNPTIPVSEEKPIPLYLWRNVEMNPTFIDWVKDNPQYRESFPHTLR